MQIGNFAEDYQKKTDEELLQLAMDSHQLTSEAQGNLTSEFAKRGISAEQIRAFGDEKKQLRIGAPEKLESVASSATVRGRGSYSIAPPLPSETSKAPWRPKVAGRIAFFFGPVAGALVVAISLRRMGVPTKRQEGRASRTGRGSSRGGNSLLHSRHPVTACRVRCGDRVPVDFPRLHGERVQRMASHSPECHALQRRERDRMGLARNLPVSCDCLPRVFGVVSTSPHRLVTLRKPAVIRRGITHIS